VFRLGWICEILAGWLFGAKGDYRSFQPGEQGLFTVSNKEGIIF
jgi:hypothetical protein